MATTYREYVLEMQVAYLKGRCGITPEEFDEEMVKLGMVLKKDVRA